MRQMPFTKLMQACRSFGLFSVTSPKPALPAEERTMNHVFLTSSHETQNKLAWRTKVDNASFDIYVPKWRVPHPWPGRIFAQLGTKFEMKHLDQGSHSHPNRIIAPNPIVAKCIRVGHSTKKPIFAPADPNTDHWEIGSTYVPYSLLPMDAGTELVVFVAWDFSQPWHTNGS